MSGLSCLGAGLVNPTITPPGGGGTSTNFSADQLTILTNIINSIAPTNSGLTAAQVGTQIAATNNTIFTNIYPLMSSGVVTQLNAVTTTLTGVLTLLGTGSANSNQILFKAVSGVVAGLSAGTGGVLTNDAASPAPHYGYTTTPSISLAGATAATLNKSALDGSFMPITNVVAYSNSTGLPVAGQALVIVGTNSFGAIMVIPTNWPSGGGGSSFPLSADANFNQFGGTNIWSLQLRTNISGTQGDIRITPDFSQSLPMLNVSADGDYLYAGMKMNTLRIEGNGQGGNFEGATVWTNSNGGSSSIQSNLLNTGTGNFTGGTSNTFGGQTAITNLTLTTSNAAPGNAVTPVIWFRVTNGTSMYLTPGYQ